MKQVIQLATKDEYDRAITAVRNGQADKRQQDLAAAAAKNAGSWGQTARDAFKGK